MERPVPYDGDKPFIFISYSHKDNYAVWPIIGRLINDGYRVWYDDGIHPGAEWDEFIAKKIVECEYFFAFLSQNYMNSDNCKDELNYARDKVDNKLLIYLEDVNLPAGMEMRLGRIQNIHINEFATEDRFYDKLYLSKDLYLFKDETINPHKVEIPEIKIDVKPEVKPEHKPVKKRRKFKKSVLFKLLAILIDIIALLILIYFVDDFIFYVNKYNGGLKAAISMVISLIVLAASAFATYKLIKKS